jgi:hypothetical protein
LVDSKRIKDSLVIPFRYKTALDQVSPIPGTRDLVAALSEAVDISAANSPKFEGKTLIAVDSSGSMAGRPSEIAKLFAAMLYKHNRGADMLIFDSVARFVNPNPKDSILSIADSLPFHGGGTSFEAIFNTAHKVYDRIIILSDMQAWARDGATIRYWQGGADPKAAFKAYKQRTGADPVLYSFDLAGYGTLDFPEQNVVALAGFSDKVLALMELLESGQSLVEVVKQVKI